MKKIKTYFNQEKNILQKTSEIFVLLLILSLTNTKAQVISEVTGTFIYLNGTNKISDDQIVEYEFLLQLNKSTDEDNLKYYINKIINKEPIELSQLNYYVLNLNEASKYNLQIDVNSKSIADSLLKNIDIFEFQDLFHGLTVEWFVKRLKIKMVVCELMIRGVKLNPVLDSNLEENLKWLQSNHIFDSDFGKLDNIYLPMEIRIINK